MYILRFLAVGALALRAFGQLQYDNRRDTILAGRERPEPNSTDPEPTTTLTHTTLTHTTTTDTTTALSPCTETMTRTSGRPEPDIQGLKTCEFTTTVVEPTIESKSPTSSQTTKTTTSVTPSSTHSTTFSTTSTTLTSPHSILSSTTSEHTDPPAPTKSEHTTHHATSPTSSTGASTYSSESQSDFSASPQALTFQSSKTDFNIGNHLGLLPQTSPTRTTSSSRSPGASFDFTSGHFSLPIYAQSPATTLTSSEHTPSVSPPSSLSPSMTSTFYVAAGYTFNPGALPVNYQVSESVLASSTHSPPLSPPPTTSTTSSSNGACNMLPVVVPIRSTDYGNPIWYQSSENALAQLSTPPITPPTSTSSSSIGASYADWHSATIYSRGLGPIVFQSSETVLASSILFPPSPFTTITTSTSPGGLSLPTESTSFAFVPVEVGGVQTSRINLIPIAAGPTPPTTTTSKSSSIGAFPSNLAVGQSDPAGIVAQPAKTKLLPGPFGGLEITAVTLLPSFLDFISLTLGGGLNNYQTTPSIATMALETILIPGLIEHSSRSSQPITTPPLSPSTYPQSPTQSCPNCGKGPTYQDAQSSLLSEFVQLIDQSLLSLSTATGLLSAAANYHSTIPTSEIPSIFSFLIVESSLSVLPAATTQVSVLSITFQNTEASLSVPVEPQAATGQITQQSLPTMTAASSVDVLGISGTFSTKILPAVIASVNHASSTALAETELIFLTAVTQSTSPQTSSPSSDDLSTFDLSELAFFSTFTDSGSFPVNSLVSFLAPQSTLIPDTRGLTSVPVTSSTSSQQPITKQTTSAQSSCTGMAGIIGAIGGFVDCSSETSSLAVQTTATNLGDSSTASPTPTDGSTSTFSHSLSAAESRGSRISYDFDFSLPITVHETGARVIPISYQLPGNAISPILTKSLFVATHVSSPAFQTTPPGGTTSTSTSSNPVANNPTAGSSMSFQAPANGLLLTTLFSAASANISPVSQTTPPTSDNSPAPSAVISSSASDTGITQSSGGSDTSPASSPTDIATPTSGAAPTNPGQDTTTEGGGGASPTATAQDTATGGAAPTNPAQGTTLGDGGGVSSTAPVQESTTGNGGAAPTNPAQESTGEDGGAAPTSPAAASSTLAPGIVIGSLTASTDSASNVVIGSQTLTPGAVATISGQQISIGSSGAIVVNGASPTNTDSGSASTSTTGPAVVVVGGTSITANSASGFVIGSQTLFPGSAITTGGEVITLPLPLNTGSGAAAASTTPIFVIGSSTFTENPESDLLLGTQTLTPGGVLTVDGQTISLSPTGNAVVVNGDETSTFLPAATTSAPVFVVGSSTFTENSQSDLVLGSPTLTPGGVLTVDGQTVSLSPTGNAVIVDGSSTSLLPTQAATTSAPIFVVGSSTFTENLQSDLVIGSQTLTPGGVLTVDGQVISLSPTGNAVIVNGAAPSTFITATASIVPQSQITSLVIAGQTLTAGGRVTVGGDVLSLAPSGTGIVVIGTITVGGSPPAAATTGKKKNGGGRVTSSFVFVGLHLVFMAFWLH